MTRVRRLGIGGNGVADDSKVGFVGLTVTRPPEFVNKGRASTAIVEADLLLIEAFDLGQAVVIAKSCDERLPWKPVKITRDGQVAEKWHRQPMNATERSRLDRVLRTERLKLEDQLRREVISFEQQRRAELGL